MFKNLMNLAFLFIMGAVVFTSTGCTDDPVITPDPVKNPPTIKLTNSAGLTLADTALIQDATVYQVFQVVAAKGTGDLKLFTYYLDGTKIDFSDTTAFKINGSGASSNPISIIDATQKSGFTWEIWANSPNDFDPHNYQFVIEDDNGLKDTVSLVIQLELPTSDLDFNDSGFTFYNNAGAGKGGIDLLTGTAQSASTASADEPHIIDRGPSVGWDNKISPATPTMSPNNTTILKSVAAGVDFDATEFKAEILTIYDNGTEIAQGEKSESITVGTVFVAKITNAAGDSYVLFRFDTINDLAGANDDTYEISIKH